ncbi:phage tail tape measure protein [Flavobacterium algicola]|uniref:hypothetical protein n=1 Tax=Flavobacterium algicola TaxID=556529 RepID=UPI001EFD26F1|nr:hypothetical protein [Flavobacterium algicola]MCG9792477.1 hypothetical protein [Flavobacterium algicola]
MASLASINIKFKVDLEDFSKGMQTFLRKADKFGQEAQKLGRNLTAAITLPVLAVGAASVAMATDYEESLNKVDTAFKSSSSAVKKFSKTALESFGVSESAALDAAALYGDMATSMGLPVDAAAKMSTSLVGLAADLASFKNIGIDEANTALKGVFTGETESLKTLGVIMTEANLQQYAYSKGINQKIKDLDQASKVQLRYNYILSVTQNAQGDFARTSTGAANQTRIFTESLKQVGQQIGSIILPLFTKMITAVNEKIKAFSNLSEGTKKTIVVIAGLAALIGPLLFSIGALASAVPLLASGFAIVSSAVSAVIGGFVLLSGAIIPILATTAFLYGAFLILSQNAKKAAGQTAELSKETKELNNVIAQGNKAAADEVGTLDKLYATATSVAASTAERKKAVESLQAVYPAYFKNIDAETIKNGNAKISYDELRDAIFNKARAVAVDNKLQQNANDRIAKELELQDKIVASRKKYIELTKNPAKGESTVVSNGGVDIVTYKSGKDVLREASEDLKNYKSQLVAFYADAKAEDDSLLKIKEQYYSKIGKLRENDAIVAGNQIDVVGDKLTKLNSIKRPDQEDLQLDLSLKSSANSIKAFDEQIAKLQQFKSEVATTAAQIEQADKLISGLEFAKSLQFDPSSLIKTTDVVTEMTEKMQGSISLASASFTEKGKRIMETGSLLSESISANFGVMGQSIIDGLGLAKNGFEGFAASMLKTVLELGQMVLKQIIINQAASMSNAVTGATAAGVATGPAAIFTTPAFIATAIGGVLAAFASIPKFETGGIVGGASFYGDKILARVNSGEMIANSDQQKKIYNAMSSSGGDNYTVIPELKIKGSDLVVIFDRVQTRKNRIG